MRYQHVLAAVPSGFLVFGGIDARGAVLDDGAIYNVAGESWSDLPSAGLPPGRAEAASAAGELASGVPAVLIFGGQRAGAAPVMPETMLGDGAVFLPASGTWIPLPATGAPSPRYRAAALALPDPGFLIAGGLGPDGPLHDVHRLTLQGGVLTWTAVAGEFPLVPSQDPRPYMPTPIFLAAQFDAVSSTVRILGVSPLGTGDGRMRAVSRVWPTGEWRVDAWDASPPARVGASLVWAPSRNSILVYGGHAPGADPGESTSRYWDEIREFHAPPSIQEEGHWTVEAGASGISVPRAFHGAVWVGDGMAVLGGVDPGHCGGGAFWDPAAGWRNMSYSGGPRLGRAPGVAVSGTLGVLAFGSHQPPAVADNVETGLWLP